MRRCVRVCDPYTHAAVPYFLVIFSLRRTRFSLSLSLPLSLSLSLTHTHIHNHIGIYTHTHIDTHTLSGLAQSRTLPRAAARSFARSAAPTSRSLALARPYTYMHIHWHTHSRAHELLCAAGRRARVSVSPRRRAERLVTGPSRQNSLRSSLSLSVSLCTAVYVYVCESKRTGRESKRKRATGRTEGKSHAARNKRKCASERRCIFSAKERGKSMYVRASE